MIISENPEPNKIEFDALLNASLVELNNRAKKSGVQLFSLAGNKLEPYIRDVIAQEAIGTPFENSIELISGLRFPDIVANKYYGIEVKTTTQNHWKTTGNSVLESTRVEDVERIFMLFAKLARPIEFRYRAYEECLSEVVVTHSPRYLIDMNLELGETIFDKIKIPYDKLRKRDNPIKPIIDYYKSKLKPGEDVWWIDPESTKTNSVIIRLWNNLTKEERKDIRNSAMAFFPKLFSNSPDKFSQLTIWLPTRKGIVCPNIRDIFTAGGKGSIKAGMKVYKEIPRIIVTLYENLGSVLNIVQQTHSSELSEYWQYKTTEKNKLSDWKNLFFQNLNKTNASKLLDMEGIIDDHIAAI